MLNQPGAPNSLGVRVDDAYRRQGGGRSGNMSSVIAMSNSTAIMYADAMVAGQLMAIVDGKAYNPSVVFANGKAAMAIAMITGAADTLGAYELISEVVTAESATQGPLYLSSTLPYYSDTPQYSNGAVWQVVGRQVGATLAVLECESAVEIEYEPSEGD